MGSLTGSIEAPRIEIKNELGTHESQLCRMLQLPGGASCQSAETYGPLRSPHKLCAQASLSDMPACAAYCGPPTQTSKVQAARRGPFASGRSFTHNALASISLFLGQCVLGGGAGGVWWWKMHSLGGTLPARAMICSVLSSSALPLKFPQAPSWPPARGRMVILTLMWLAQRITCRCTPRGASMCTMCLTRWLWAESTNFPWPL